MTKVITLKLNSGSLKSGFDVSLEVAEEGKSASLQNHGYLPANHQLYDESDRLFQMVLNSALLPPRLEAPKNQVKNVSEPDNCAEATQRVIKLLNQWLTSETFNAVRDEVLKAIADPRKPVRILIATDDIFTQRLPWHEWTISTQNAHVEIGFSRNSYKQIQPPIKFNRKVKILAIIGEDKGINPANDLKVLAKYGAAITPLINSTKSEVIAYIGKPEGWDILFFAGHSYTEEDGGVLKINNSEYLTIPDVKKTLTHAISKGLQLAIFNSCDGIGLARDLADLNIPQSIFMRQPIPDVVATKFLEDFLRDYTRGNSLYLSVRNAREKLEQFQAQLPGVTSFPVIYQNPSVIPPTWHELRSRRGKLHEVMVVIAVILGILLMRHLGVFAAMELKVYDHFMQIRPPEGKDDRLLIVTVDEPDLQYQNQEGMTRKGSLSDAAFSQIIARILPHQPRVIGSDIYHDFPVDSQQPELASFFKNHPNFLAICKDSDRDNNAPGIAPPPEVPPTRLGFSNVLNDTDGIIRRHLWYMDPAYYTPCPTPKSFSLQVALSYLQAEGIEPEVTPQGYLKLGGVYLTALDRNLGGYHKLDTRGYQMLLNYRSGPIADTISLTQLLTQPIDPNLVRDRIILIGNITHSYKDFHRTPTSRGTQPHDQTAGVFIQAQMVSQIISAVQDNRPLMQPIPRPLEIIWILAWSSLGGFVGWRVPGGMRFYFTAGGIIVIIYGVCFVSFMVGYWIPLVPSGLGFALTAIILKKPGLSHHPSITTIF
ncbi:CHASE2 domain-containing protein [Limnospira fusiformis]|uniref:CHASE2 domain-containing protein n=1 Tax=Limnospira fusiformis TaxID=54297 RepID=UPI0034E0B1B3